MSPEKNKVTVRRFYDEVITQKHLAVLDELMGDHYVSHDLPSDPAALKFTTCANSQMDGALRGKKFDRRM